MSAKGFIELVRANDRPTVIREALKANPRIQMSDLHDLIDYTLKSTGWDRCGQNLPIRPNG